VSSCGPPCSDSVGERGGKERSADGVAGTPCRLGREGREEEGGGRSRRRSGVVCAPPLLVHSDMKERGVPTLTSTCGDYTVEMTHMICPLLITCKKKKEGKRAVGR